MDKFLTIFANLARKHKPRTVVFFVCFIFILLGSLSYFLLHCSETSTVSDPFGHGGKICSIDKYGAKHKDAFATREAFQKAFSDCAPGGTVYVPRGIWITGAIRILSDTTLRLDDEAVLSFDSNPNLYLPGVPTRFEGMDVINFSPLIYAKDCKNVALIGRGKLIGNGEKWWSFNSSKKEQKSAKELYELSSRGVPLEERVFASLEKPLRPSFIQFYECENVHMEGLTVESGPMWTVHPVYSKNLRFKNINVQTAGPNTDGIALDSVDTAVVEESTLSCGDDGIVVKSGLDYDGWKQNRPSKNIQIRNVVVTGGHSGVAIGSELSGGIENVSVENSSFSNSGSGIRIKTIPGRGGYVRGVSYRNIRMSDIGERAVQIITDYSGATIESTGTKTSVLENISIENVEAENVGKSFSVKGESSLPIRLLNFSNIRVKLREGEDESGLIQNVSDSVFENVAIEDFEGEKTLIFKNVQDIFIRGKIDHLKSGARYGEIQGEKSKNIRVSLDSCDGGCVTFGKKATAGSLIFE